MAVDCVRCGQCCVMRVGDIEKECPYLLRFGKLTSCRVYNSRLGRKIGVIGGRVFRCGLRSMSDRDFVGCPQNKGGK